jgi:hypothetical protein
MARTGLLVFTIMPRLLQGVQRGWIIIIALLGLSMGARGMLNSSDNATMEDILPSDRPKNATFHKSTARPSTDSTHASLDRYAASFTQHPSIPYYSRGDPFFIMGALLPLSCNPFIIPYMSQVELLEAFRYQVNATNSKVGNESDVLINTTVAYNVVDTLCQSQESVSASLHLLMEDVPAIVGPVTSSEAFLDVNFLSNYDIGLVSPLASGDIAAPGAAPIFLEVLPSNSYQTEAVISLLLNMNWTLVIPIYDDSAYGATFAQSFQRQAAQNNISITCSSFITFEGSSSEVSSHKNTTNSIVDCIVSQSQATVVLLFSYILPTIRLLTELSQNPGAKALTFIGTDSWSFLLHDPRLYFPGIDLSVAFFKGSIIIMPGGGIVPGFVKYFTSLNPSNTNYTYFTNAWEHKFRCILPSSEGSAGLPQCTTVSSNRTLPPSCICTGKERLVPSDVHFTSGYTIDSVSVILRALDRILNNCSSIPINLYGVDFCALNEISGLDIIRVARAFPIVGSTGTLAFNGINRAYPAIDFVQVNEFGQPHIIGTYNDNNFSISHAELTFKTSPNSIPISAIIPQEPSIDSASGLAVLILSIIIIAITVVVMIVIQIYRRRSVIRRSSPLFCQLILIGILLLNSGTIVWVVYPSTFSCLFRTWTLMIGLALIFSNLFAKTYRIHKIFSSVRIRNQPLTNIYILKYTIGIMLFEIVLLVVYTFANGVPQYTIVHDPRNYLNAYGSCTCTLSTLSDVITTFLLAFNAILIFFTALLAYLTRNVDESYNESKYIALTVYISALIYIITLPIYFTISQYGTSYVVNLLLAQSVAIFLVSVAILSFIFLPKILRLAKVVNIRDSISTTGVFSTRLAEHRLSSSFQAKDKINVQGSNDKRRFQSVPSVVHRNVGRSNSLDSTQRHYRDYIAKRSSSHDISATLAEPNPESNTNYDFPVSDASRIAAELTARNTPSSQTRHYGRRQRPRLNRAVTFCAPNTRATSLTPLASESESESEDNYISD